MPHVNAACKHSRQAQCAASRRAMQWAMRRQDKGRKVTHEGGRANPCFDPCCDVGDIALLKVDRPFGLGALPRAQACSSPCLLARRLLSPPRQLGKGV